MQYRVSTLLYTSVFLVIVLEKAIIVAVVGFSVRTASREASPLVLSGNTCGNMRLLLPTVSRLYLLNRVRNLAPLSALGPPIDSSNIIPISSSSKSYPFHTQSFASRTGWPGEATAPSGSGSQAHGAETRSSQDTIFALSTGNSGPAGVAVIRISGSSAASVLETITAAPTSPGEVVSRKSGVLPPSRRAVVRRLYDPGTGDLLDEAMVLWMPGPRR